MNIENIWRALSRKAFRDAVWLFPMAIGLHVLALVHPW